jgi:hypothetical protein
MLKAFVRDLVVSRNRPDTRRLDSLVVQTEGVLDRFLVVDEMARDILVDW